MKNYVKHSILGVFMFFIISSFLSCGTKLQGAYGVNNFDLSKYKLTQGYLEAIEDESNKGIDLHQGISGN